MGFEACFAFRSPLLSSFLLLSSLFLLSSCSCPASLLGLVACFPAWLLLLVLSCFLGLVGLLFLFPLRTMHKKKGRKVFLRPLVLLWNCLDVLKHYRYFLRFIVPMSSPFADNSCDRFGSFRWVVYNLPVVVNG